MRIDMTGKSMGDVLALADRLGKTPQLGVVGIGRDEIVVYGW